MAGACLNNNNNALAEILKWTFLTREGVPLGQTSAGCPTAYGRRYGVRAC